MAGKRVGVGRGNSLPPKMVEVIHYLHCRGFTQRAIADVLGVHPNTVIIYVDHEARKRYQQKCLENVRPELLELGIIS